MYEIKAIETVYNGYLFRSRLEARWAVFFDALGVKYEYEPQGYQLESGNYLPDFWLPDNNCFIEIKGRQPSEPELEKARYLAFETGNAVCFLVNTPHNPKDIAIDESSIGVYECVFYINGVGYMHETCFWYECGCGNVGLCIDGYFNLISCKCNKEYPGQRCDTKKLLNAYRLGRQARFEHGETPRF